MIATKKAPGTFLRPGTHKTQTNNIIKFNPEEDISEPLPEEHPEDLSRILPPAAIEALLEIYKNHFMEVEE